MFDQTDPFNVLGQLSADALARIAAQAASAQNQRLTGGYQFGTEVGGTYIPAPEVRGDPVACFVRGTSTLQLPEGGAYQVTWLEVDEEQRTFDTGGFFDEGEPTLITIPEDGYYLIGMHSDVSTSSNSTLSQELYLNSEPSDGSPVQLMDDWLGTTVSAIRLQPRGLILHELSADDVLRVYHRPWALTSPGASCGAFLFILKVDAVGASGGGGGGGTTTDATARAAAAAAQADADAAAAAAASAASAAATAASSAASALAAALAAQQRSWFGI